MDSGSKLAAVPVSSATRTAGMRLTWTSSVGMAPSFSMTWSLASTCVNRAVSVVICDCSSARRSRNIPRNCSMFTLSSKMDCTCSG